MTALIGITCESRGSNAPRPGAPTDEAADDQSEPRYAASAACAEAVVRAGGAPVFLPFAADAIEAYLETCHGFILVGEGDPDLEPFGQSNHARAQPCDPDWQAFATAMLAALDDRTHPVLGIDLGMRLMALHDGGTLHAHLPDALAPDAAAQHLAGDHPIDRIVDAHEVLPTTGCVASAHHQAVAHPGRMRAVAAAADGLIEAVDRDDRPYYLGVQWRAEAAADEYLGQSLFNLLVDAAQPAASDAEA